ncbi:hypothetical protein M231_07894 [Tremella mesenterica]|uniref:Uncharacterized protein n=1 Tax=Tremella mesenterica TaxID=5217 RepID=A0A4Q1B809_TREME|nr:hypothetical protein M231_07894 [Tremella mesenterica]
MDDPHSKTIFDALTRALQPEHDEHDGNDAQIDPTLDDVDLTPELTHTFQPQLLPHLDPTNPVSLEDNSVSLTSDVGHTLEATIVETSGEKDADEMKDWTQDQLKAEVLRLRQQVSSSKHQSASKSKKKEGKKQSGKRSKSRAGKERDLETGKRVEKSRKTELGKAVRSKISSLLGIGPTDPLPPYSADGSLVPNWYAGANDPVNVVFEDRVTSEVLEELHGGIWPRVPNEDMTQEVVQAVTRTALFNLSKRYLAENDQEHQARKEKYAKTRRRWARKDLKQKRRSKASTDPTCSEIVPSSALHMDYMSSEYSSAGEDSEPTSSTYPSEIRQMGEGSSNGSMIKREVRAGKWRDELLIAAQETGSKAGWAEGQGEKVLEVRTPIWRSEQLNNLYARLDIISSQQATARTQSNTLLTRPGHVAPSHRRFVLPPDVRRKGKMPRQVGEAWMWASGQTGVWPNGREGEMIGESSTTIGENIVRIEENDEQERRRGDTSEGGIKREEDEGRVEVDDDMDWDGDTGRLIMTIKGMPVA